MGAILVLAAVSFAAPGFARDTSGDPGFAANLTQSFGDYASTPDAAQVSPDAPDAAPEANAEDIGGGLASWYGPGLTGHSTASGERFNPSELTAAHRSLPFGSLVRVTDEDNGRTVVVRINDRGPFTRGRVIDLSEAAARELGIVGSGAAKVSLALLDDD